MLCEKQKHLTVSIRIYKDSRVMREMTHRTSGKLNTYRFCQMIWIGFTHEWHFSKKVTKPRNQKSILILQQNRQYIQIYLPRHFGTRVKQQMCQ